jgi:hypothetical protein
LILSMFGAPDVHYACIRADGTGASVFDDVESTGLAEWSARTARLQPVPPNLKGPLHPEPEPTLATVLAGWVEITSSGGKIRRLASGETMLFADTSGLGTPLRLVRTVRF